MAKAKPRLTSIAGGRNTGPTVSALYARWLIAEVAAEEALEANERADQAYFADESDPSLASASERARRECDRLASVRASLIDELVATPAQTLEEVVLLLRVAANYAGNNGTGLISDLGEDSGACEKGVVRARIDLERLLGMQRTALPTAGTLKAVE